ncbi:MAG: ATP-dependent helicase [Christensenellales bacterium]|jgi:DNA helicase-2/ATP-dependent DNA helicase PcrA
MGLKDLNDRQREAVLATEGAVLVLAGAGSGKTRVLTMRAAYLIEKGTAPYSILALTFTNKAALEMKDRISAITDARDMWVFTFHAMCTRLLRIEAEHLGYAREFTIYDAGDSLTVVKECLSELDVAKDFINPKVAKAMISRAKNEGINPAQFIGVYGDGDAIKMTARVYAKYEDKLRSSDALDFDDLLLKVRLLFNENPDILEKYQRRFRYIMVDEYQDTNKVQYDIVRLLAQRSGNLFVVGDDDQSIYGWRGADITNILAFEKDFPGAKVIRLEQNYRSHQHILDAANAVIANNAGRMRKELWSLVKSGQKPLEFEARSDGEEAEFIAAKAESLMREGKYKPSDIAVLYRMNSQSRVLENKLKERGVPYVIYGGVSFYQRKEIKDILAYLNLLCNPNADLCFVRAVGVPKRGIGKVTLDKLITAARERSTSLLNACAFSEEILPRKASTALKDFAEMILSIRRDISRHTVLQTVECVLEQSGLREELLLDTSAEGRMRLFNVEEFIRSAADFEKTAEQPTLEAFLERNALISDMDTIGDEDDAIMLMTLHSAKGLEFPVVFITGVQEGLLPHQMSIVEGDIEEERRLCYVGMTRAKKRLYLTWSAMRLLRTSGGFDYVRGVRSRFLGEIPDASIEPTEVNRPGDVVASAARSKSHSPFYFAKSSAPPSFKPDLSKQKHAPDVFVTGGIVEHPKFGKGKITATNGDGEEKIAVVNFESLGEKKMFVAFAPLKIIG